MSELTLRRSIIGVGVAAVALSAGLVATLASARPESARPAANVAVDCEPTQRAIVRQAVVDGQSHVAIECASITRAGRVERAASYASVHAGQAMTAGEAALVPAVYQVPEASPVPVTRPSATSTTNRAASTSAERPRSWQKRAVVIGGAAGAGAGIGALIGGRKGALIGAAVGGGSGTLYEVIKK